MDAASGGSPADRVLMSTPLQIQTSSKANNSYVPYTMLDQILLASKSEDKSLDSLSNSMTSSKREGLVRKADEMKATVEKRIEGLKAINA